MPVLLKQEEEPPVALIAREVDLQEAGFLDILLVNRDGLPIAVEVKLQRNSQVRREVVAQAIDYISALTSRTVDELDEHLGGRVEEALRSFDEQEDEEAFERRWRALGANLRGGLARLLVAVDGPTPGLERILRFLAENSELDVQLMVIQRFATRDGYEILAARSTFSPESISRTPAPSERKAARLELLAAVELYNTIADPGLNAIGIATYYRQIHPSGWPASARTHYEFYQTSSYLGAELHIESDQARPLSALLAPLAGKPILGGTNQLLWDQAWSSGRGRLAVRFALSEDAAHAAQAMKELINLTCPIVTPKLQELVGRAPQN